MAYISSNALSSMQHHLQNLLDSARFSDLVVRTKDREFKVHKSVVSQCGFFAGACSQGFVEAESGVIEMLGDEPRTIDSLIHFLYSCDYSTLPNNNPLLYHAEVYATAEKYCMPLLKSLAAQKFKSHVTKTWTVDDDAKLDFLDAVEYIYDSTPETDRVLRDLAVSFTQEHSRDLFNMSTMSNAVYQKARGVLQDYPEFTMDLALASSMNASHSMDRRDSVMDKEESKVSNTTTSASQWSGRKTSQSALMVDRWAVLWT